MNAVAGSRNFRDREKLQSSSGPLKFSASSQPNQLANFLGDVRFTPESGHGSARWRCPLCAKSRHATPRQDDINRANVRLTKYQGRRWKSALEVLSLSTLWPTQSEITLGAEHIAVKACDPLPPPRGHIQVLNSGLDMWRNAAPKKMRV
jgi:hypothetical protein